jgi:hypothetical protein
MVWVAIGVGAATAAAGAYTTIQGQKASSKAQANALAQNQANINAVQVAGGFGASGEGTSFLPNGGVSVSLGQLDPQRQALLGQATSGFEGAESARPSQDVQLALRQQQAQQGLPQAQLETLNQLNQGVQQQFGQSQQDLQRQQANPFQQGLQRSAFAGAQQFTDRAGQSFESERARELNLLRQQARPFEDRAFQNLQEGQFATGRAGTSGGGIQTEAFARGLAQADISRQLSASDQARLAQTQNLQQAQGLTNLGTGVRGVQDQLLNTAFDRFSQTANLGADFDAQSFNRTLGLNELEFGRAQTNLGSVTGVNQFGQATQQSQQQFGLNALQGNAALSSQATQLGELGLARGTLEGNLAVGAGTNVASIVGSPNFNPGGTQDLIGGALTNIGGRIVSAGTADNDDGFLKNLFGGG